MLINRTGAAKLFKKPRLSQYSTARIKTFDNQSKIPRLPIPTLQETAAKYLTSLQPLLTKEELSNTEKLVTEFIKPNGQGELLQKRLIDYEKTQQNGWLEQIWYHKAYLDWPDPIMINVNWWLQFKDSVLVQPLIKNPPAKGSFTDEQISRAALLVSNMLEFKHALDNEQLPPEYMGKKKIPLCMNQYRMQFGVTRIPGEKSDAIIQKFPCQEKHIILLLEDQIYSVQVADGNGVRSSLENIESQIKKAVEMHLATSDKRQPAIGLLTSEYRPVWAKVRSQLLNSPVNKKSLSVIEKSLFSVCLDNFCTSADVDASHRVIFHGLNGRNRWFDKSLSFIFMNNGRGGCNGEHSPSDAVIPGQLIEYVMKKEQDPKFETTFKSNTSASPLPEPQLLTWETDKDIDSVIEKAEIRAQNDIADTDSVLLHFNEYGADTIKTRSKMSPDAYVQMALQLAYFRTYFKPCATYESASTRQFLHGRTETIRSCSKQSVEFTRAFDDPDKTPEQKLSLLQKAIDSHVKYAIDATNAKGVDRHLLGLRMMLAAGEEAAIFKDPAFAKSCTFTLSTSNVSPGDYFYGGFGPVAADGYGVNYAIGKQNLKFSISSRRHSKETCSSSFRKILQGSLQDIMKMFP